MTEPAPSIMSNPLAGQVGWIISDGKAGHEVQGRGIAEALELDVAIKRVAPRTPFRQLSPWGPVDPRERFAQAGTMFSAPWPAIAFATGRTTIPYLRALKRHARSTTFTVILLDPKTPASAADVYWVPEHDRRRGANVMTTLTSPHAFSPARLDALRHTPLPQIVALPSPRVAVLIGGPNGDYNFTPTDIARLTHNLAVLALSGASLMISPSRRTPPELLAAIDQATAAAPRIFYAGTGPNPYADFLANADAFVVTADSVNMAGEAAATGRPIYIFNPSGGSEKFARFHRGLRDNGITRDLPEDGLVQPWTYPPLNSAAVIAAEIVERWSRHAAGA